jgi:hypothetical protein
VSIPAARPPATPRADRYPAGVNEILTSGLAAACHYAPARPHCQILANARYGPIALCERCGQRRSTAGKATAPTQLPDPHALLDVAAARDASQQAAAALRDSITRARQAGQPWPAIAAILGVSRQAAQQRFTQAP